MPVEGIDVLVYDTHAILFPVHTGDNKCFFNRPVRPTLTPSIGSSS